MRWLLAFALLGCAAVRVAPPDELPPLPSQIASAFGPVRVQLVPDLHADSTKVWGAWYWGPMLIQVERNTTRRAQWLILYHEECHVAFDAAGLTYLTPGNMQEAICEAQAAQRFLERRGR